MGFNDSRMSSLQNRYTIIAKDFSMFASVYLSLFCAFTLGIYTLNRAYERYFAVVESSALSDHYKAGCNSLSLSDIGYQLISVTFGDGVMSALTPGRSDSSCGGIMVISPRSVESRSSMRSFSVLTEREGKVLSYHCLWYEYIRPERVVMLIFPIFNFCCPQPDSMQNLLLIAWVILTNLLQVQQCRDFPMSSI
jgi:hypothetical protein